VSVIAQDKHGSPIPDLTEADFRIFDNGQEQKMAFFSKVDARVVPVAGPPPSPNTWTNRGPERGAAANVTLILFDALNTRIQDQAYAREQIVRFLSQIHPDDRVALYTLGRDLRILHDFTSDARSLLRVLSHYKGYNGPEIRDSDPDVPNEYSVGNALAGGGGAGAAAIEAFLAGQDEVLSQYQTINRALRTADALEAIATHVAAVPGRKNLVWISGGFPFTIGFDTISARPGTPELEDRNFLEEVQRAARALTDANVAVYPVDAHGLVLNMTAATRMPAPYRRGFSDPTPTMSEDQRAIQTMDEFAARTGGRAFYRTNDFSAAIRAAIDDSKIIYSLAYTPTHNEWNGKFRPIKVESRRPGVRLRYRSGYFALPDRELDARQREHMVAQAEWSSLEATEINLSVYAVAATVQGKPAMKFVLTVDPADVRFTEQEGRHAAELQLVTVQKAEDRHTIFGDSHDLSLRLKEDSYQDVLAKGLRVSAGVVLDPAATDLRFVVLDAGTGRLGSVDVPVPVRAGPSPAGAASPSPPAAPRP
jgi:VWFA-related protein